MIHCEQGLADDGDGDDDDDDDANSRGRYPLCREHSMFQAMRLALRIYYRTL